MALVPRSDDCIFTPSSVEGVLLGPDDRGIPLWLCAKASTARVNDKLTASAVDHSLLFLCMKISFLDQLVYCLGRLLVDSGVSLHQPPFCSLQAANVIFASPSPLFTVLDSALRKKVPCRRYWVWELNAWL